MIDCTERHTSERAHGLAGEGQKGMPSRPRMTDCTEPRLPHAGDGRDGEGQKGMRKVDTD
jgi:hypothetical protein